MTRSLLPLACLLALLPVTVEAQTPKAAVAKDQSELRYVIYFSRHGVRSPTGKAAQYNTYSRDVWPSWPVQPGYLTPHGYRLMEIFGAYDRTVLANEGLVQPTGCADAPNLTIYADSDQRTRETGKALAQGLMPGCNLPVQSLPEGTNDPLFHSVAELSAHLDQPLAEAAIAGRLGGDPANVTQAYHTEIAALDQILANCGAASSSNPKRVSLFDIPATLSQGTGDHLADLKGPINTASTLSENLLLEYAEGMDSANVGWGCVHRAEIETLMSLHTAATDFTQRTPEIARAQASNLLNHIRLSIQQALDHKEIRGALGKPSDRALFLIGHDTNLENISGLLGLTWIVDGRRDDTPPGGALILEASRKSSNGEYSIRAYFTAQTVDQMRAATTLTPSTPPDRVPVFIPGCSREDFSCTIPAFTQLLERVSDNQDIVQK
jgi:4-phytase / acid phosphatase